MAKFEPGQSGNPGGRPKGYGDLREKARGHTEAALQVLVEVMNNKDAPASARATAADAVLDRGWGRPESSLKLGDGTGDTWSSVLQRVAQSRGEEKTATETPAATH